MNLPVIGRIDLKSVVFTVVVMYFVLPYVMGWIAARKAA